MDYLYTRRTFENIWLVGTIYYPAVITCLVLENPKNGMVFVTGQVLDSRATYFCNVGFMLVGAVQRRCNDDGQWGEEEPQCVRKWTAQQNTASYKTLDGNNQGMRPYVAGYLVTTINVVLCILATYVKPWYLVHGTCHQCAIIRKFTSQYWNNKQI